MHMRPERFAARSERRCTRATYRCAMEACELKPELFLYHHSLILGARAFRNPRAHILEPAVRLTHARALFGA